MKRIRRKRDRGGVTVEFGAVVPTAFFITLLCFQAFVFVTTVERVENAARTGAREASKAQNFAKCRSAAQKVMPDWIVPGSTRIIPSPEGISGVRCQVEAKVPFFWPQFDIGLKVKRTVVMPVG